MLDAASKLVSLGVTRVLTSGGCADALTGAPAIRAMQQMYGDRIQVLAGGGVRAGNILRLVEETGVSPRPSGRTAQVSDPSTLLNPTLNFGSSLPPSNDATSPSMKRPCGESCRCSGGSHSDLLPIPFSGPRRSLRSAGAIHLSALPRI